MRVRAGWRPGQGVRPPDAGSRRGWATRPGSSSPAAAKRRRSPQPPEKKPGRDRRDSPRSPPPPVSRSHPAPGLLLPAAGWTEGGGGGGSQSALPVHMLLLRRRRAPPRNRERRARKLGAGGEVPAVPPPLQSRSPGGRTGPRGGSPREQRLLMALPGAALSSGDCWRREKQSPWRQSLLTPLAGSVSQPVPPPHLSARSAEGEEGRSARLRRIVSPPPSPVTAWE